MALALILIERLQDGLNVIIGELDHDSEFYNKQLDFLKHFVNQWCNAEKSIRIQKYGTSIKQQLEPITIHNGIYPSNTNIQRFNFLVSQITDYFKEQDAISSDKCLKLNNNLISSQMKSSKNQKDFNYFIALINEEYFIDDASIVDPAEKLELFIIYFDNIVHQIVGRYQYYPESE